MTNLSKIVCVTLGALLIIAGLTVFGVRLLQPGPYAIPEGGSLLSGLGAIALGGFLLFADRFRVLRWIAWGASPLLIISAMFSFVGDIEEVIILTAEDPEGQTVDLRLWVVDRDDGPWVGMGRQKAETHSLSGARLEMLRAGEYRCVTPQLDENREITKAVHAQKVQKYRAAQIFGAMGLYPLEATENTVVLHLDACTDS